MGKPVTNFLENPHGWMMISQQLLASAVLASGKRIYPLSKSLAATLLLVARQSFFWNIVISLGKLQRPHVATEAWNHGLFEGNHPQMAARFRLVNDYNLPRFHTCFDIAMEYLHMFIDEWPT